MTTAGLDALVDTSGLAVRNITKRYSGVEALGGVSVEIQPGQILGLVGHNGAGKSTLLKTMSGAIRPDSGTITIDGREVVFAHPADALKEGIATVYQELSLLPNLTVTQNVFLGHEKTAGGVLRLPAMKAAATEAMAELSLPVDVDRVVGSYPVAVRQLMEIAVAIHRDARYLLLDEPTTSLEGEQITELLAVVKTLARERGIGVLYISHKLEELYQISDRVVALVDGLVRIDGPTSSVPRADLIAAIAGSEAADLHLNEKPDREVVATDPDLAPSLVAVSLRTPVLEDVTVTAYPGQVLGTYGLVGSGRTEFLRVLMGLDPLVAGSVELFGRPYQPTNTSRAAKLGLAYVTEERKAAGIVPVLNSLYNVALPILHRFARFGVLNVRKMQENSEAVLDQLRVLGDRRVSVENLSGGNQQKVVLARALGQTPKVLLLDEPTKGVDIGVKVEIHRLIRELARDTGMTIILVSSEEEEILDVSDVVSVFAAGQCRDERRSTVGLTIADLRQAAWAAPQQYAVLPD
ncbi:MAG: sugar ABC transporter ATP-binding protein [Propionibacteriaceae bacterium]|jgi:ABC-type sugar transport system ATPase subunit|nr:sugar ABC transporter ATP-binding protein [Propionibacteriaceae bacterium]